MQFVNNLQLWLAFITLMLLQLINLSVLLLFLY